MIEWGWALAAAPPGAIVGWASSALYHRGSKPVAPEQLKLILRRIVNQEAIEVQGHMRRVELMRANRRTQRFDGGKPAIVHKMRCRKRTNLPPH